MAKNPMYSPWLEYAPTFRWGGREWGEGQRQQFIKRLGGSKKYNKWARQHRIANKVFDPIEGEVYSQVQPVITGIDAERKKRAEYYTRLMQNLGGFTQATQGMLGAIAPAIGGAYSEAANTIGAAGTGYGRELNAQMAGSAATANATQEQLGAPEGQRIQAGDAGGVLAGLAGWIPETLLNTQGGAFAKAASALPETAGIEAQINMKSILDKAMEEEEDFSTSITELLQKVPGLRSEAKTARQKNALLKQELQMKNLEKERDWFLDQSKLALSLGKYGLSQQYADMAQQRVVLAQNASKGLDSDGNLKPGYEWKNGRVVETTKPGKPSTSSTTPGTPAYKAARLKDVGNARSKIDKMLKGLTQPGTLQTDMKPILPKWADAYKTLYQAFKHLAVNPATKKRLDEVIRASLSAAGIKPGNPNAMGPPAP